MNGGAGDQKGCLRTYHMSESYLDVSGIPCHANCKHTIPSQTLRQLEQSSADIYQQCNIGVNTGPWERRKTRRAVDKGTRVGRWIRKP
ncbi:hypothetical protein TNCV_1562231 [Trichonephila clavipes]|nr:hypothetical protein TNCV_1562231 [Trichonephila clavipes]